MSNTLRENGAPVRPACPRCGIALPIEFAQRDELSNCLRCGARSILRIYPAGASLQPDPTFEEPTEDGSRCYYHSAAAGREICHRCGRILCALCEVEFGEKSLCSDCIGDAHQKEETPEFVSQRLRYDDIALALAVAPPLSCFFAFFSIITAPMAIVVVLRYWNTPLSIVRSGKTRFVLAALLALAQIALWFLLIWTTWMGFNEVSHEL